MINIKLDEEQKKKIPKKYKELAIVRKLQLIISPYLKRNSKFFLEGDNIPDKSKAYKTPVSQEFFESNLRNEKVTAVVCRNLCELAVNILAENGVTAEVITCDSDIFRHAGLLITSQSGEQYIVNILEDLDLIQSFMKTPNFASQDYYKIRYEKFESNNGITTNGNRIKNIAFISSEDLLLIDTVLGYLENNNGMYMNDILDNIKEKLQFIVNGMDEQELLSRKLDWIFTNCNDRMNIKGHTDFVMYYSQTLLKGVLTREEYNKLQRYDGFTYSEKIPEDSILNEVLDFTNPDYDGKLRFSVVQCGDNNFIISTKPNSYVKISNEQLEQIKSYCVINISKPPSELAIYLRFKGNALPLIFHSIGKRLIAEKQESLMLDDLDEDERKEKIEEMAQSIKATDEPITSILIPYESGNIYIYLDKNNDFTVEQNGKRTVYYYNTKTDEFTTKTTSICNDEKVRKKIK